MKEILKKVLLWTIPCTIGQLSQIVKPESEMGFLALMVIVCFCWMVLYDFFNRK